MQFGGEPSQMGGLRGLNRFCSQRLARFVRIKLIMGRKEESSIVVRREKKRIWG